MWHSFIVLVCFLVIGLTPNTRVLGQDEAVDIASLLEDDTLLDALLDGDTEVLAEPEVTADLPVIPESKNETEPQPEPTSIPDTTVIPETINETSALWDIEHRLLLGGGHKRNALFSASSSEDSAFTLTEWETTILRLGQPSDWQFLGFLLVENRHYADVDGLDNEWMAMALAQIDKPMGDWKVGLSGQYLYLEQAFSLEFEELDLGQAEIVMNQFAIKPKAEIQLSNDWKWGFQLPIAISRFQDDAQDYDEFGFETFVQVPVTDRVRLTASYGFEYRDYAEREAREADGTVIPGSHLTWDEHDFELELDVKWGASNQWRSRSALRHRIVQDSSSGYQDFHMTRFSQTLRYEQDPWSLALLGSYTHYDYPVQTKTDDDSNHRHRSRFGIGFEARHTFSESWDGLARYDYERFLSNVDEDNYEVHVFTLGLHHTF